MGVNSRKHREKTAPRLLKPSCPSFPEHCHGASKALSQQKPCKRHGQLETASLNSQVKLPVSLSGSGLVSKPMGEGVGGEKHLGSPSLGRAGGMLSPPVPQHRGARALVAAWLFTSASRFAAGDKGKLSFAFTMVVWVRRRRRRRRHACAD